ncbi:hypothetical protein GIB67_037634 [Kingdonia uniflora]|uniref:Aminotransferase-like plant mobile domain-containing protein n=1 Tax=Kingdonia uniflora TaxID=39325 RepID=A0A7J7LSG4_9MAGN|nr:hypothetical protein GIB67_037634 [Kingdonia uniflora]
MYLTIEADWEDDIAIGHICILFLMGYLWFQTANDTIPLGYLAVVANLDEVAQYDWGYAILTSLYHSLNIAVTTESAITRFSQLLEYCFYEYCGVGHPIVKEVVKYLIDHRTIETIAWRPWLESAVSELDDVRTTSLLSRKRMPLQVLNGKCEYYLGNRCWRQLTGTAGEEQETYASYWAEETAEVDHLLTDSQRMGNIDMFGPSTFRAESVQDAQRLQELTDENVTLRRHLDSVDDQLYAHDLHLRKGRDVRGVPLPPGGGAKMRQCRSGPRTRGGGTSRRGRGTGDNYGPTQ